MGILKTLSISHKRESNGNYCILLQRTPAINQPCLIFEAGTVVCLGPDDAESVRRSGGYTRVLDGYACLGLLQYVYEGSKELHFLLIVTGCVSVGKIQNHEIFCITEVTMMSMRNSSDDLQFVRGVKSLLGSGCFYFAHPTMPNPGQFDITIPAQKAHMSLKTDNRFFWNRLLHVHFERYGIDTSMWLVKVLCGGVNINTVYIGGIQARACLISRLSSERAGTRFNVRGVNDLGHVANFVETELVIYLNQTILSYNIIRGSIPLFWEQPGIQVGSHRIRMSRGSEISQAAYDKHMFLLKERFDNIVLINLLSSRESEVTLNQLFNIHHKASKIGSEFPFINYDYHALSPRGNKENLEKLFSYELEKYCDQFGFFHSERGEIMQIQRGVFRINCLDCLDRTNSMQTFIGLKMLSKLVTSLERIDLEKVSSRLHDVYSNLWILNGDQISRIYTGTGALEGKNLIKDGALSVARTIQNNLLDDGKQNAIDILILGKTLNRDYSYRSASLLPPYFMFASPNLLVTMCDRYLDYCRPETIRVTIGTWNVNGGKHSENSTFSRVRPLSDWLVDYKSCVEDQDTLISCGTEISTPIDIYAIGFQEIVDLNATNIVASSSQNQRDWLIEIQKAISKDNQYLLVTSVQLVGVCLFIFIRSELASHIRDVCSDHVKTGLKGAAGNKGAVAVRFRYKASSLCFVCAHFAAGQHQAKERNDDYTEITRRIQFPMGRSINSHDYVFWCGDFNYRLDNITNEETRQAAEERDYKRLLAHDQLRLSQNAGLTFKNYIEGEINFAPTYKYDTLSQDYDSSEKCRIPAYTDRILFKKRYPTYLDEDLNDPNQIKFYNRIELLSSDHRPVVAELAIEILEVDKRSRGEVFDSVLSDSGPPDATVFIRAEGVSLADERVLSQVLKLLTEEAGEVVLIRYMRSSVMMIFRDGRQAVRAAQLDGHPLGPEFPGCHLIVNLRTPDWHHVIKEELKTHLYNTTNLVTGEGPTVHLEDDEDETAQELNMSIGPEVNPDSICVGNDLFLMPDGFSKENIARSPSPQPPPLPPKSPLHIPSRPPPPLPAKQDMPLRSPLPMKHRCSDSYSPQPSQLYDIEPDPSQSEAKVCDVFGLPDVYSSEKNDTASYDKFDQSSFNLLEFSNSSFDVDESISHPPPTMAPPAPPTMTPTKQLPPVPTTMTPTMQPPPSPSNHPNRNHQISKPTRAAPPPPIPIRNQGSGKTPQPSPKSHII